MREAGRRERGVLRPARADADLLARSERFRTEMLPYLDAAYSYARYLTRDAAQAEDIVHDAFVRALGAFDGWRGENAKAWLLAIVRNRHLDWVAARSDPLRGAQPLESIDAPADEAGPDEVALRRSDAAHLRRAIETLPEPFREALVLRELEEFGYKAIADLTCVPLGTVMSRLARARAMLADLVVAEEAQT